MKLYMNPASAPSRAIMLFVAETGIEMDTCVIDLSTGEQCGPEFLAINPNGLVPVLEDGDFILTEGAAILRYLVEKSGSPMYPSDLQQRARINEAIDWFNSNLYRDVAFNLTYPQIFDHHHRRSAEGTAAAVAWGQEASVRWLRVLDEHLLGDEADYLCLGRLTIADLFGACLLSVADLVRFDLSEYPNIVRWLGNVSALSSWDAVNAGFRGLVDSLCDPKFIAA